MNKHTPIEWEIDRFDLTSVIKKNPDGSWSKVCSCNREQDDINLLEDKANAKFIVRACNCHDKLLEALKSQQIWLEQEIGEWLSVDISQCTTQMASMKIQLNEIEQAIAKAEQP